MLDRLQRIFESGGARKIGANSLWLLADRLLRMTVGLFVGVWVARYLGPGDFGLLSYAIAFVALATNLSMVGLQSVVIREAVRAPNDAGEIFGSAIAIRLVAGCVAICVAVFLLFVLDAIDTVQVMVLIMLPAVLFRTSEIYKFAFESRVESKYAVMAELTPFALVSLGRVALVLAEAQVVAFSAMFVIDAALCAWAMRIAYKLRRQFNGALVASWQRCKLILASSWPLALSGLAVFIYMKIDQIMLGAVSPPEELGYYSAALKLSEIWYTLPTILVASVYPSMVAMARRNPVMFGARVTALLSVLCWLGVGFAVCIGLLASNLVELLYGRQYGPAAAVLILHMWVGVFVFMNIAGARWYVVNELQRYTLIFTVLGAFLNVVLNLMLIPKWGAMGASVSTLACQAVFGYVVEWVPRQTRPLATMKSLAFTGLPIIRVVRRGFL